MCFVSRPIKNITFPRENGDHPKRVVDFLRERDTFRNIIMEIVKDFREKSNNNDGKPWKSPRILRVKPFHCFHFVIVFVFLHFFIFSFSSFFFIFLMKKVASFSFFVDLVLFFFLFLFLLFFNFFHLFFLSGICIRV